MRAWKLLPNAMRLLALAVINVHLAYGVYVCEGSEQCTKVQECQERLHMSSKEKKEEIAEFVMKRLCKFTMEGIHVCCPMWNPIPENTDKDCDSKFDKKYNDRPVFPWHAKLLYKSQKNDSAAEIKCTGSLISQYYVLTAAHCLTMDDWVLTEVWLAGETKMPGSQILVEKVINYTLYKNKNDHEWDVGLVKLRFPVNTELISPVCLSRPLKYDLKNEHFLAIDRNGGKHYATLVSTEGSLMEMKINLTYGDSGAALFHVSQSTRRMKYFLLGVYTGWHQLTGNVYFVNIDGFIPWIKDIVNNISN